MIVSGMSIMSDGAGCSSLNASSKPPQGMAEPRLPTPAPSAWLTTGAPAYEEDAR